MFEILDGHEPVEVVTDQQLAAEALARCTCTDATTDNPADHDGECPARPLLAVLIWLVA